MLTTEDLPDSIVYLMCLEYINDGDINHQLKDFLVTYRMSLAEYERDIEGNPVYESLLLHLWVTHREIRSHFSNEVYSLIIDRLRSAS